jgi:hypothetical protein
MVRILTPGDLAGGDDRPTLLDGKPILFWNGPFHGKVYGGDVIPAKNFHGWWERFEPDALGVLQRIFDVYRWTNEPKQGVLQQGQGHPWGWWFVCTMDDKGHNVTGK